VASGAPGLVGSPDDSGILVPGETAYVFDSAAEQEAQARFAALPAPYDPGAVRHPEALGVGPGWRCPAGGAGRRRVRAAPAERAPASMP
jgi:hypothetical protein